LQSLIFRENKYVDDYSFKMQIITLQRMTWLRANTEGKIIFRPQANKKQDRSNNAQETLNDISVLTIESDVTIVLNCRKLMISLAGKHEKNFHDRL